MGCCYSIEVEIGITQVNSMMIKTEDKFDFKFSEVTSIRVVGVRREHCYNIAKVIHKLPNLKVVVITKNGMNGGEIETIVLQLQRRKLESLDLSGNHVSKNAASILRKMMANGQIEELNLQYCDLDSTKLREILQGFRESKEKMKLLDLTGNSINNRMFEPNKDVLLTERVIWDREVSSHSTLKKVGKGVAKVAAKVQNI